MKSEQKILKIHEKDNVLVALADLKKGTEVIYDSQSYIMQNDIPAKHKFVTEALSKGDLVYMYGVLVGKAKKDIAKGDMISTTNVSKPSVTRNLFLIRRLLSD